MSSTRLLFDAPFSPWLVAGLALALLATTAILTHRDTVHLRPAARWAIRFFSFLGALLLAGMLLNPRFVREWPDPQAPRLTLLVDGSRSMQLADEYQKADADWLRARLSKAPTAGAVTLPRADIERLLLRTAPGAWLAEVREKFDIAAWRFAGRLDGLALDTAEAGFDVDPDGHTTALGTMLEEATRGLNRPRPRAVVLISDGAWNTGRDPAEVGRALGRLGIPVYAVGLGDPEPPRDLAVLALRGPRDCLVGDMLFLKAELTATGTAPVRLTVELLEDDKVVEGAERPVVTLPGGRPATVELSTVPTVAGAHRYTARVRPLDGERNTENNQASTTVEVIDRKLRVLLIDAEPRWEFRFLRSVLERDPGATLTVCLLRPGIGPIEGPGYLSALPTDKKGFADLDLVLLGDVPRSLLPDAFLKELADFVRVRGGALVVVAGRRGHYRQLAKTPVEDILPVELRPGADPPGGEGFSPVLSQEGLSHIVTRLAAEPEENERVWGSLPPLTWTADVGPAARGASALLLHPSRLAGASKQPIFAVQSVGAGKVFFSGTEETWRWRKSVGDKYHYRFWAQAFRWLVRRNFAEGDALARLSLSRAECTVGEKVEIEAYCLSSDGFPLTGAQVSVRITPEPVAPPATAAGPSPGQPGAALPPDEPRTMSLQPAPGGWGLYRGEFIPRREGRYSFAPIVSTHGPAPLRSSATLTVTRPDLEKAYLAQDRNALQAVAEASGGRYLTVSETGRLPALLEAKAERRLLTEEFSPFRHWLVYALAAAALALAWLLRKWMGLP